MKGILPRDWPAFAWHRGLGHIPVPRSCDPVKPRNPHTSRLARLRGRNPFGVKMTGTSTPREWKRLLPLVPAVLLAICPLVLSSALGSDTAALEMLLDDGRLDQAEERADALLAEAPGDPSLLFTRALIAERRGEHGKAAEIYGMLIRDHPTLLAPYNNLAVHHAREGDYEAAAEIIEKAFGSNPTVATAYDNLTAIYGQLAGAAYRKALNATTPLPPPELATLDRVDSLPGTPGDRKPVQEEQAMEYVDSAPREEFPEETREGGIALAPEEPAAVAEAGTDLQLPEPADPGLQDSPETGEEMKRDILATIHALLEHMNPASREQLLAQEQQLQSTLERLGILELRLRELEESMSVAETGQQDPAQLPAPAADVKTPARDTETAAGPSEQGAVPSVAAAAEVPVASPKEPAGDTSQWEQALIGRITDWAEAWSSRDAERYLSHYSDQFVPPNGMGIDEWQTRLHEHLDTDPPAMAISVDGFSIQPDGDTATVRFSRHLGSGHSEEISLVTLVMRNERGDWRIVRELN